MFNLFEDNVSKFVKDHSIAVIATVDTIGQPNTSTIFYIFNDKHEMFFITKSQTTKYKNILKNSSAALTVLDEKIPAAVNLTGVVKEIKDDKTRDIILQQVFNLSYEKLHDYAPIIKLHKGSFSVLQFVPSMAKMTDFSNSMGNVKEDLKEY